MTGIEPVGHLSITVIIPTYNRCDRLTRLLTSLDRNADGELPFNVVVVNDGSTDGTNNFLATYRPCYPMQVIRQSNRGPAAARNAAVAIADGELLVFLDDDVTPTERLLQQHASTHKRDGQAVAIGPMVEPPGGQLSPWLRWEAAMLKKQYDAMQEGRFPPTPRQFYTGNASVRREHVVAAGGFDETFTRAEDVELAYRLADRGLHFYFLPTAAVLHDPHRTLENWCRVPYEYGRYDVLMARDRGRPDVLRLAYRDWSRRHLVNRVLPRICVGHRWRSRAAAAALSLAIRYAGPLGNGRATMALCSLLFNLQYWRGIADATGLGARVWDGNPLVT
jgi:GT2 family glycosyltransferase